MDQAALRQRADPGVGPLQLVSLQHPALLSDPRFQFSLVVNWVLKGQSRFDGTSSQLWLFQPQSKVVPPKPWNGAATNKGNLAVHKP